MCVKGALKKCEFLEAVADAVVVSLQIAAAAAVAVVGCEHTNA